MQVRVCMPAGNGGEAARGSASMDRTESAAISSDGQEAAPAPLALVLQTDADVHSLVTSCCAQTLYQLPSAMQEVTKALQPAKEGAALEGIGRAPSGALETADEEAAAAEAAAATALGVAGMPRQPSARPGPLTLPDVQGAGSDGSAAPSAAPSPHDAAEEQARRERSESGGLACGSSPSVSSAAEAARAAWAASAGGGAAAAATAERARWRPARASFTGEPKRTLGLKLSPRTSMGSTATDRLLGRRGLDVVGGSDDVDDVDGGGGRAVAFLLEWEACVRVDADSRLQLVAPNSAVLVACGFDELGISGKSVTALRLGGTDRGRRPSQEAAGMQRRGSAALQEEDEQQETGRPGLFTAEFSVQVGSSAQF